MCCQYLILMSGNKCSSYLVMCSKVPEDQAIDCAFPGFNVQTDCLDKGCCIDNSGSHRPHCYFPHIYNAGNAGIPLGTWQLTVLLMLHTVEMYVFFPSCWWYQEYINRNKPVKDHPARLFCQCSRNKFCCQVATDNTSVYIFWLIGGITVLSLIK